jgi:hypothetical protein
LNEYRELLVRYPVDALSGPPGTKTRKFTVSQNYFLIKDLQRPWLTIAGAYGAATDGGATLRA